MRRHEPVPGYCQGAVTTRTGLRCILGMETSDPRQRIDFWVAGRRKGGVMKSVRTGDRYGQAAEPAQG